MPVVLQEEEIQTSPSPMPMEEIENYSEIQPGKNFVDVYLSPDLKIKEIAQIEEDNQNLSNKVYELEKKLAICTIDESFLF